MLIFCFSSLPNTGRGLTVCSCKYFWNVAHCTGRVRTSWTTTINTFNQLHFVFRPSSLCLCVCVYLYPVRQFNIVIVFPLTCCCCWCCLCYCCCRSLHAAYCRIVAIVAATTWHYWEPGPGRTACTGCRGDRLSLYFRVHHTSWRYLVS